MAARDLGTIKARIAIGDTSLVGIGDAGWDRPRRRRAPEQCVKVNPVSLSGMMFDRFREACESRSPTRDCQLSP